MRSVHQLVTLLALAAVPACADGPLVADGAPPPRLDAVGGGPTSATGSGHYFSGGEIRTLAFSAVRHDDGAVSGEYQLNVHALDAVIHVRVECLLVVGNRARLGGTVVRSTAPAVREGLKSYFWVVDNGEGADALPDIVSTAGFNEDQEGLDEFCHDGPTILPPHNVIHGNVQVRE